MLRETRFSRRLILVLLLATTCTLFGQESDEEGLNEVVIVTASRTEESVANSTSMVTVVSEEELETTPLMVLDDQLRQIPGFSLFRRSSSLSSHPTTQGVSLRGIGPSGTSRSLVLLNGMPLNDPFGGWVYWNRIPSLALRQVEVSRGAGSQLYGSSSLGGTIQLLTLDPQPNLLRVQGQLGSRETWDVSVLASDRKNDWGYLVSGRVFDTGGFLAVDESVQGEVDVPVTVDFQTLWGTVEYKDFHASVNAYHEDRGNGTRLQENSSKIFLFETGIDRSRWKLNFYTQSGVLESQFSRILPDRSQEFPTAFQRFESDALGASGQLFLGSGLLVGSDWRFVSWDENDQNLWGLFAQQMISPGPRLDLQLGVRFDIWENNEVQTSVNPRLGVLFRLSELTTLRGSIYKGFRAPTLNELYRPFRVGSVLTSANPDLTSEKLWGGEGGIDFHPSGNLLLRFNSFWNRLDDPISNVTIGSSENLILRQRQNVDYSDIWGVELESVFRPAQAWTVSAAYLYSSTDLAGTGLRLPQAPVHRASGTLSYTGPLTVTVQGRVSSSQFDDDLNELVLGSYGLLDIFVARHLSESFELFFSVENLFDEKYAVARTPVERLGEPRMIYGGVRWDVFQ